MSADTILVAVGDVAAGVAAVAAVIGLRFARQTVREGEAARVEAEKARIEARDATRQAAEDRRRAAQEAAEDRRQIELDRLRHRVERVGEIVEDLFWSANRKVIDAQSTGPSVQWMADRNRLGVALVGVTDRLPECAKLLNASTAADAFRTASVARQEVLAELDRLNKQTGVVS
jgi:hypothetical protein